MSAVTIKIYPESWAAMNVDRAGAKYRPGNGTEGELFVESWCGQCERDHGMLKGLPLEECDDNQVCDIIARSFAYNLNDAEYPTEWQYGSDGQPQCHAFVEAGQPIPVKDELTLDMFASQCGDCGGTRKVGGLPCPVCCPTDDGPDEGMKNADVSRA